MFNTKDVWWPSEPASEVAYWHLEWAYRERRLRPSEELDFNEKIILKSSYWSYRYAKDVLRERWLKAESVIQNSSFTALKYAEDIIKGPWPEAESIFCLKPGLSYNYAKLIGKRFPKGEDWIAKDERFRIKYVKWIIQGRWLEIEPEVLQTLGSLKKYISALTYNKVQIPKEWLWRIAKTKGLKTNLKFLVQIGCPKEIQDYVIRLRPDLVNLIRHLDPELRDKYQHEVELSRVDL
jgi:hypothetical protein